MSARYGRFSGVTNHYGTPGHGVLGSVVRAGTATGATGPGFLYNDWRTGDDAKEFRGLIVVPPASGTLFAREDGSFDFTAPADGVYDFTYRLYVDGADLGTAAANFTVGVASTLTGIVAGQGAVTWTGVAAVTATVATGVVASVDASGLITWSGEGQISATIGAAAAFVYGRVGPFTRVPPQEEQGVGLLGRYSKQPNEVIDYPVDFSEWMRGRPADAITAYSVSVSPSSPEGITPVFMTISQNVVTSVWAGGVAGASYQVTTSVSTAAGLVKSAEFQIRVWEV